MNLTEEKICEVYFGATGQSLREQDQRLAFAFARAILKEAGVEELERDAERYRHFRKYVRPMWRNGPGLYWYLSYAEEGTPGEKLDAGIDEAMKEK